MAVAFLVSGKSAIVVSSDAAFDTVPAVSSAARATSGLPRWRG